MPTYVMLTTLGPDGWETLRENPERILAVREEVEVAAVWSGAEQKNFRAVLDAFEDRKQSRIDRLALPTKNGLPSIALTQ